ncbi:MAG TPA: DUF1501 domain-containing protein [Pirellulales bacterium]|nr:DUF1501 domain-containing protein [Pirellulales bacterium]
MSRGAAYGDRRRRRVTRRTFVEAGGLSLLGLGLPHDLRSRAAQAAEAGGPAPSSSAMPARSGFGRAKSVLVLFLYGAPSQMDTLDPKPDAPVEVRGDFKAISTSLPGIAACELLPNIAKNLHRVCLLRSMSHTSNNHAVSVALSGLRESTPAIEGNTNDPRHQPYFGSVLEYLWKRRGIGMESSGIPVNMVLPWPLNQKTDPGRWQHHAAWLGRAYNPVTPAFIGQGSLEVGAPSIMGTRPILTRFDPWDGVTGDSRLAFNGAMLPADVPPSRLDARLQFLRAVVGRDAAGLEAESHAFDRYRDLASAMIANPTLARTLDVTQEPRQIREQYGLTMFGQSVLTARRLIENGVKVVTVFWDTWTDNNAAWDTHHNHHPRLKHALCPKLDQVLPAFLNDMESRGLLDETLVLVISEHGRTPAITRSEGGGREHWAGAYCGMFFGAGIRTGQVVGATDRFGAYPISHPTHPNDILATVYHLLGFDPAETTVPDRLGRPMRVTEGNVVRELLV